MPEDDGAESISNSLGGEKVGEDMGMSGEDKKGERGGESGTRSCVPTDEPARGETPRKERFDVYSAANQWEILKALRIENYLGPAERAEKKRLDAWQAKAAEKVEIEARKRDKENEMHKERIQQGFYDDRNDPESLCPITVAQVTDPAFHDKAAKIRENCINERKEAENQKPTGLLAAMMAAVHGGHRPSREWQLLSVAG